MGMLKLRGICKSLDAFGGQEIQRYPRFDEVCSESTRNSPYLVLGIKSVVRLEFWDILLE